MSMLLRSEIFMITDCRLVQGLAMEGSPRLIVKAHIEITALSRLFQSTFDLGLPCVA